jgi:hypothetical protein
MTAPDLTLRLDQGRCGVYHLVRDGEVVYVGQSINVLSRLGYHPVPFDEARIYFCAASELDARERADLARLRPRLNVAGVVSHYIPPTAARMRRREDGGFDTPAEYLRSCGRVNKGNLRAVGVIQRAEDLGALMAEGFPSPIGAHRGHPVWDGRRVAEWVKRRARRQPEPAGAQP